MTKWRLNQLTSWTTTEKLDTKWPNGIVPRVSCPIGMYRVPGGNSLRWTIGQRIDGCRFCPRGRYGQTTGLESARCTNDCPKGRYRDRPGGTTENDCYKCPEGQYGDEAGLKTSFCSASCPVGKYSDVAGIEKENECKTCPTGYRGWQCSWEVVAQNFQNTKDHAHTMDQHQTMDKLDLAAAMQVQNWGKFVIVEGERTKIFGDDDAEPPVKQGPGTFGQQTAQRVPSIREHSSWNTDTLPASRPHYTRLHRTSTDYHRGSNPQAPPAHFNENPENPYRRLLDGQSGATGLAGTAGSAVV